MIYNALNQTKVRNLSAGKYADGQGLWLIKRSRIAGKWILRLAVNGKCRQMGLGRRPDVSIGEAREKAGAARRSLRDGEDPIQQRTLARQHVKRLTLEQAIFGCFEARQAELKGDGKAGRWLSPLAVHIIPAIGSVAVEDINRHLLKRVLDPIWHEKPDTVNRRGIRALTQC